MLPLLLRTPLAEALRAAGNLGLIDYDNVKSVYGGDISQAARISTRGASYFVKWNHRPLPGMFPTEARGLALLAQMGARVPEVYAAQDAKGETPGFILEEWLDTQSTGALFSPGTHYGEQLAAFHLAGAAQGVSEYGLDHDNYLGLVPQHNTPDADWTRFFRERRLRDQTESLARQGLLPADRIRKLETLMERLGTWLDGVERQPVLLHGDLWQGNVQFLRDGIVAFIDPAVYWGDREVDLATVEIYSPAPDGFFAAYRTAWPIAPGYELRRGLYHLSLWLTCLLCGQDYRAQIDATLRRYVG